MIRPLTRLTRAIGVGAASLIRPEAPPGGRWDAIVVPGCAVLPDGTPSPALARRTRAGVALWGQGLAPRLVLSGGVVTHPPAEAIVAGDLARRLGVPDEALVLEVAARSTAENARYTAALGVARRVVVVTDDFHAARCHVWFAACFEAVAVVGVRSPARFRRTVGEIPATVWAALTAR